MTSGGKNLRQLHELSPSRLAYGKVARELPVASAQLIRLELAQQRSLGRTLDGCGLSKHRAKGKHPYEGQSSV
jgi:hypothetical protein